MKVRVRWSRSHPHDVGTAPALWRELAALLRIGGILRLRPYATFLFLFATGVFGIALPWRRSLDFYDPLLLFAYSLASVFLSGPAATDLVGSDWDSARTVLARVFASSLFCAGLLAWLVAIGITTVNVEIRPALAFPDPRVIGAALAFAAAGSLLMAAIGALIAVILTPVAAKLIVRGGMIVALTTLLFGPRMLSPDAQVVLAVNLRGATLTGWAYVSAAVMTVVAIGPINALRGAHR